MISYLRCFISALTIEMCWFKSLFDIKPNEYLGGMDEREIEFKGEGKWKNFKHEI